MTLMEHPAPAPEQENQPNQNNDKNPNRRVVLAALGGAGALGLLGLGGYGAYKLGQGSGEAPVASPEPSVEPTTEPAPEPTTEAPTVEPTETEPPVDAAEPVYGGFEPGIEYDALVEQMQFAPNATIDQIAEQFVKNYNLLVMGGSWRGLDPYTASTISPDSLFRDMGARAEEVVAAAEEAMYGPGWEMDSDNSKLVEFSQELIENGTANSIRAWGTSPENNGGEYGVEFVREFTPVGWEEREWGSTEDETSIVIKGYDKIEGEVSSPVYFTPEHGYFETDQNDIDPALTSGKGQLIGMQLFIDRSGERPVMKSIRTDDAVLNL